MRVLLFTLTLVGTALASGCVVVPSDHPAVGFYGPFPAVFVPDDDHRGRDRRDYDRRDYDSRNYRRRYRTDE